MKSGIQAVLRILAGIFFLFLGLTHFYYTRQMAIFVPLPSGSTYFVYLNGILITLAAFGILANWKVRQSFVIIACVLAITGTFVQLGIEFRQQDEIMVQVGVANVLKIFIAVLVLLGVVFWQGRKQ
jgi:uncharacterized membrane protein